MKMKRTIAQIMAAVVTVVTIFIIQPMEAEAAAVPITSFTVTPGDGEVTITGPVGSSYYVRAEDNDGILMSNDTVWFSTVYHPHTSQITGGSVTIPWPNGSTVYLSVWNLSMQGGYFDVLEYQYLSTTPTAAAGSGPGPESTPEGSASGCLHSCEWRTESEASETADGVIAYICTKCGAVTDYMKGGTDRTSAYAVFNQNVIAKVNQAKAGETLQINTQLWTSFSMKVMEAIAANRNINIELTYRLAGKNYQIVIPAGAAVPADVDFAGFDGYLAGLYGKTN